MPRDPLCDVIPEAIPSSSPFAESSRAQVYRGPIRSTSHMYDQGT